jgi:filamentous hemagglutinin
LNLNKSLASQQQLSELESGNGINIAGCGTNVALNDISRLVAEYGGEASDWSKVSSSSYTATDGTQFQIHAYQNAVTDQVVEPKSIPLN